MTDRLKGFTVSLTGDVREDEAATIAQAINMIKGVLSVEPVLSGVDDQINRARIRMEIEQSIWKAFREQTK